MKKIFITLLLFCFYVAQGAQAAMIIQQFTSGGGEVEPVFEADWSTNSPGSTDITCSVAGGCPDTWTSSNGSTGSVSSGELIYTITGTDSNGDFLEKTGLSLTEFWVEFTWESTDTTTWGANSNAYRPLKWLNGTALSILIFDTDATEVDNMGCYKVDDALAWGANAPWFDPSADTAYTIRVYVRVDSDGGADVGGDDGIVKYSAVGLGTTTNSNVDNDLLNPVTEIHFGIVYNAVYDATSRTDKFDDFKLYTSDPGWVWD